MRILLGLGHAQVADSRAREHRGQRVRNVFRPKRNRTAKARTVFSHTYVTDRGISRALEAAEISDREGRRQFAGAIGAKVVTDNLIAVSHRRRVTDGARLDEFVVLA